MRKGATGQGVYFYAWDTAASEPKTGDAANITATVSKNGAAAVATTDVNPTEISGMSGIYWFDITASENDADAIMIQATTTTANILIEPVMIYTR